MKNGSAYLSNIIYTTKKLAKLAKSLRHSLRVEIDGESSISYKKDTELLNKILFNGKSEEFIQNLNEMTPNNYLDLIDEIIKTNMEKEYEVEKLKPKKVSPKDAQMRSKSLSFLKKNIEDEHFHELLQKFEKNPHIVNKNELIIYFDTLNTTKKSIKNNLDKYINVIEKVGKAQNRSEARLSIDKVEFVEMVIKIPHENNILNISSEEMLLYNQNFYKKHFPDYEIVLGVSHNDELHQMKSKKNIEKWEREHKREYVPGESGFHSHVFINTKNKNNGEFDYWTQQFKIVEKFLIEKGISREDIKRDMGYINEDGIRKQNLTQVKNMGKSFQDFLYEEVNENLFNDKGYNAVLGFNELSLSQKQDMEREKTLSINNRSRNGAKLELSQIKEEVEDLELLKEKLEEESFNLGIESQQYKGNIEKLKLEEEETTNKTALNNEIIEKQEKEIQNLKEVRKKVSREDMDRNIPKIVNNLLRNNRKFAGKILNEETLKPALNKEFRKFIKIDIYDNDIKEIKNKIQKESDIKVLEKTNEIIGLKEEITLLKNENEEMKNNLESKIQEVSKPLEEKIANFDKNLESKIQEVKTTMTKGHREEILKLDNIIDNKDFEIKKLNEEVKGLKKVISTMGEQVKSLYSKLKNVAAESLHKRTKTLNNFKEERKQKISFRNMFQDLDFQLGVIKTIHPKLEEEVKDYWKKKESERVELPDYIEDDDYDYEVKPIHNENYIWNKTEDKKKEKKQDYDYGHTQ